MEDYSKELLRTGIIEAKSGNHATARRYLDRAIYMAGSYDVIAEAWFWMSEVSADLVEKRKALIGYAAFTRAPRACDFGWQTQSG